MTVRLRPALPADLPRLREVERAASALFRHSPYAWIVDDEPHDLATFERWRQAGIIFVAEVETGTAVGFAAVETLDGQGFLTELDVHPAHGRQGLGRRLIAAACQWSLARGHTALRLSTFTDVAWNAPFYARLGFRPLADSELGPGLRAARAEEAANGLDITRRVLMTLTLTPPGKP